MTIENKSIKFLLIASVMQFAFLALFLTWSLSPLPIQNMNFVEIFSFCFIVSLWSFVVSICYASLWREEVGCNCLEKENDTSG